MDDYVKFKRTLVSRGDSAGVNLPKELIEFLEIRVGDQLIVTAQKGKKGKFLAVFKEGDRELNQ